STVGRRGDLRRRRAWRRGDLPRRDVDQAGRQLAYRPCQGVRARVRGARQPLARCELGTHTCRGAALSGRRPSALRAPVKTSCRFVEWSVRPDDESTRTGSEDYERRTPCKSPTYSRAACRPVDVLLRRAVGGWIASLSAGREGMREERNKED